MKIAINDVIFREDLYPRFEPNQSIIQKYSNSIKYLPPIKVNQNNILIDGFHRLKAHQIAGMTDIEVEIIETISEKELKKLAYQWNSNHGIQLSNDEKRKYANEMIGEMEVEELEKILSVKKSIIYEWTKNKREELEQERNRRIVELYLNAVNTQESIAEMFGISQQLVTKIITTFSKNGNIGKDFIPFIYNIWNTQKGNDTEHFGSFPKIFMDNLLYYHTNPLDIIFDPFAGNGTTIDSCKDFFRRYYCSDLIVKPGREKDIFQHDIIKGLPNNLPKPKLVFLDPPYWTLAEKEYSENDNDLGNMKLDDFREAIKNLTTQLKQRKVEKIAYLIRSIWITGDEWIWNDPMIEFYDLISDKYYIETRYVIPYSTQQYSGLWVDRAKENNKCLILNRELTVFKLR